MAKIKDIYSKHLIAKLVSFLIICLAGMALYIGLQVYSDSMYQYYSHSFKRGQIADEDLLVNNSVDIFDEEATNKLVEENSKAVLPVFTHSMEKSLNILNSFEKLRTAYISKDYDTITEYCGSDVCESLKGPRAPQIIFLSSELLVDIVNKGFFSYSEIKDVVDSGYSAITVSSGSGEYILDISDDIITEMNLHNFFEGKIDLFEANNLTLLEANAVSKIVNTFLVQNNTYDEYLTSERRQTAADNTEPIFISFEKGQVLIAKDRVITDEQLEMIRILGNSSTITLSDILGESAFILITMLFAMCLFLYYLNEEKTHCIQDLWITTFALIITCVISFFTIRWANSKGLIFVEPFVPVCFVPVLITMITSRKNLGYISSLIVGLLVSATPGSTYLTFIYCTLCGIIGCALVRLFNKRTDMFVQWAITLIATSLMTALFIYIGSYSNHEIFYAMVGNAIQITGTEVLIAIILPILEGIFNLPTVFKLNELSYGNNPLLAKLSEAAPGTYSHSKMVSELSEAASKAIGANYNLARVGGLYHDIGKTEYPEYFVENQSGTNKHEELNPSLSVSVIKSHVKVGEDKAREAGLPAELIDIIANHHGNDIIAYFYNEARKQADNDDIVSSTDFSYSDSNIPETKECAIVMLADSVEAAARTVSGASTAKFTKLINTIVFGKIERGQLDHCDLSMKEIDAVRESFLKTLSAQYHNRIEYPDEEEEK